MSDASVYLYFIFNEFAMKLSEYLFYPYEVQFNEQERCHVIRFEVLGGVETTTEDEERIDECAQALFIKEAEHLLRKGRPVPSGSSKDCDAAYMLQINPITGIKIMLRNQMNEKKVSRSELARRLGTSSQSVVQSLTLYRSATSLDTLLKSFDLIGLRTELNIRK